MKRGQLTFVKDTAVGGADVIRHTYLITRAQVTGNIADHQAVADMEPWDERADPKWEPDWLKKAEKEYEDTNSVLLAGAQGVIEGGKQLPVVGTGIRLGENIDNATQNGRWCVSNTRSLGGTVGEIGMLEVARRIGNKPAKPRPKLTRRLPPDADKALREIRQGSPRPNVRNPKPFQNDGRGGTRRLPETDAQGSPIRYTEHTVNPRPPGGRLDGNRIVTGSDGSVWYTPALHNPPHSGGASPGLKRL